jgi:hypothetical protein
MRATHDQHASQVDEEPTDIIWYCIFLWRILQVRAVHPAGTIAEALICSQNDDPGLLRRALSGTGSGHEGLRVDQAPVPWAPARALLRLTSAEDCFGLILRDNEAALPRLELEQGGSGLRGWLADLRHGSDIRYRTREQHDEGSEEFHACVSYQQLDRSYVGLLRSPHRKTVEEPSYGN